MKIVSFNIRTLWDRDGINSFIHIIGLIYEKINEEKADVIAFQEVTEKHIDVLTKLFPDYAFVGSGRHENGEGEGLYTAYLKAGFDLAQKRVFWLSDTPDKPASRFKSQSIYPRICVYSSLVSKENGERIGFYNVHLDYLGTVGHTEPPSADEVPPDFDYNDMKNPRELGIKTLLSEMKKMGNDEERVVLGDFNAVRGDECFIPLHNEGFVDLTENVSATFHSFGKTEKPIKIDYIYASPALARRKLGALLWQDQKNGIYLSDHYPVAVEIR